MKSKYRTINKLLIFFTLLSTTLSVYQVSLSTDEEEPRKINFQLDFASIHIIILSNQIDCENMKSCTWLNDKPQKGSYDNIPYTYKEAYLNLKMDMADSEDGEQYTLKVFTRIAKGLKNSVIGLNDINALSNNMEYGHEIVVDLKDVSMKVKKMKKSESNSTPKIT